MQQVSHIDNALEAINFNTDNIRGEILEFESKFMKMPGVLSGDNANCQLTHKFSEGVYARELFIPKGTMLTGKIHKDDCLNVILSGDITVISPEGKRRIKGACTFVSPGGTKRIGYAHEDTTWINIHKNTDNETDLSKIEERVIAKDFTEFEKYITEKSKSLALPPPMTNCGLIALKNLTDLKNISVRTLLNIAEDNGLKLYPYKVKVKDLHLVPLPAIFHAEDHFIYISKPEEFDANLKYTGNVLLTTTSDFDKVKKSNLIEIQGSAWIAAISASVAATGWGVSAAQSQTNNNLAQASTSACKTACLSDCKANHGAIFGGRQKCIKSCYAGCDAIEPPPSTISPSGTNTLFGINIYYLIAIVLVVIVVIVLIFLLFRKK